MSIKIGENYRVSRKDEYNWVVEKYMKTVKKQTNEKAFRWKDMGVYLGNLERCLCFVSKDMINDGMEGVGSLDRIVEEMQEIKKEFRNDISEVMVQINKKGVK